MKGDEKMFLQQMESQKISSWGIRFYWNAFKQNGQILFPDKSLILNNGWDNSGRHKDSYNIFPTNDWEDNYKIINFPDLQNKNENHSKLIAEYLKRRTSFLTKIINKLSFILTNLLRNSNK